eukprot:354846-Chlamydomonas_euryale.AAC.1
MAYNCRGRKLCASATALCSAIDPLLTLPAFLTLLPLFLPAVLPQPIRALTHDHCFAPCCVSDFVDDTRCRAFGQQGLIQWPSFSHGILDAV